MSQSLHRRTISSLQKKLARARLIQERQRLHIRNELSQVQGLIPMLMKRRNGGQWSAEDRIILQRNLRSLSSLSTYLIPLIMPGGILLIPVLAWWLDNRREKRKNKADQAIEP
jgi:16S rRNA G527 N7-methylase RsmG